MAAPVLEVFEHVGPRTEAEFLDLATRAASTRRARYRYQWPGRSLA